MLHTERGNFAYDVNYEFINIIYSVEYFFKVQNDILFLEIAIRC